MCSFRIGSERQLVDFHSNGMPLQGLISYGGASPAVGPRITFELDLRNGFNIRIVAATIQFPTYKPGRGRRGEAAPSGGCRRSHCDCRITTVHWNAPCEHRSHRRIAEFFARTLSTLFLFDRSPHPPPHTAVFRPRRRSGSKVFPQSGDGSQSTTPDPASYWMSFDGIHPVLDSGTAPIEPP